MKRTYETCGKSFTSRKAADRFARNIANASGLRVPVYETTGAPIESEEFATILDDIISSAQNWASEDADQPTSWCDEWKKVYPLLAAAPKLLAACRAAHDRLETLCDADEATDNDVEVMADLEQAIREATRKA